MDFSFLPWDLLNWALFVLLHVLNFYKLSAVEPDLTWLPFYALYALIQTAFCFLLMSLAVPSTFLLLAGSIPSLFILMLILLYCRQKERP